MSEREYLTEEEARALWQRAAELQAEAARRAEALNAARPLDGEDAATPEGGAPDGYALTHVRAAALEAGIGDEFVEAALAEVRAQQAVERVGGVERGRPGRLVRTLLRNPPEAIVVSRTVMAAPKEVLRAMEAVLPAAPFGLSLRERTGDPTQGGVLVFDIPGVTGAGRVELMAGPGGVGPAGTGSFAAETLGAGMRQILATVTGHPGDRPFAELTLTGPVAPRLRGNAASVAIFAAAGGGLGWVMGLLVLAVAGATGAAVPFVIAGGIGAGGWGLSWASLSFQRLAWRHGREALERLAAAVATEAEGGWGLSRSD